MKIKRKVQERAFSRDLFIRLSSRGLMRDEYTDLLLSEKSLDTAWFGKESSFRTIKETFARVGPSLEKVCFSDTRKEEWNEVVCYLPNVKDITCLDGCHYDLLESIAENCHKLEKLDISRSNLCLSCLQNFPEVRKGKKRTYLGEEKCLDVEEKCYVPWPLLKEVYLNDWDEPENLLQLLINMPLLEKTNSLHLPEALHRIHKKNIQSTDKVFKCNITHLDMLREPCTCFACNGMLAQFTLRELGMPCEFRCHSSEVLESCFRVCPNLKSLSCFIIDRQDLNLHSTLQFLEVLNLLCKRKPVDVSDFLNQNGGNLTHLSLIDSYVSLSAIDLCPKLKRLSLDEVRFLVNENDSIHTFHHLKTFIISHSNLSYPGNSEAICRIIASSPVLQFFCLRSCKSFSSEMKAELLKCCERSTLQILHFEDTIDLEFLKAILLIRSTLKTVRLDLRDVPFGLQDIRHIAMSIISRPKIDIYLDGTYTDEL